MIELVYLGEIKTNLVIPIEWIQPRILIIKSKVSTTSIAVYLGGEFRIKSNKTIGYSIVKIVENRKSLILT